jgi:ATP-dependent Clp protease adapter protein ClpS
MAKLKGKGGQQKVTVEHVHVHKGGQAIVGEIRAEQAEKNEQQIRHNDGKSKTR